MPKTLLLADDSRTIQQAVSMTFAGEDVKLITASDGEKRVIGPGEVFLVEDTHGKGHLSKSVAGKMRHSIFVPID